MVCGVGHGWDEAARRLQLLLVAWALRRRPRPRPLRPPVYANATSVLRRVYYWLNVAKLATSVPDDP